MLRFQLTLIFFQTALFGIPQSGDTIHSAKKPEIRVSAGTGMTGLEDNRFWNPSPPFSLRWTVITTQIELAWNKRYSLSGEIGIPLVIYRTAGYNSNDYVTNTQWDPVVISLDLKYNGVFSTLNNSKINYYASIRNEAWFYEKIIKGWIKKRPYYYLGMHAGVQRRILPGIYAEFNAGLGMEYWNYYDINAQKRFFSDFTGRASANILYRFGEKNPKTINKYAWDTLSTDKRVLLKANLLKTSIAAEARIYKNLTLYNQVGLMWALLGGEIVKEAFNKSVVVVWVPLYVGNLRYYYNMNRRIKLQKRTGGFSANYFALQAYIFIGGDRLIIGNTLGAVPYNSYSLVTGLQRKFAKRFYFDINAGYGLYEYRGDQFYNMAGFIGIGYAFN